MAKKRIVDSVALEEAIREMASRMPKDSNPETLLPISVEISDTKLYVVNHRQLTEAGLVPYIFRKTKKRNGYSVDEMERRSHCCSIKGWNLRGFCGSANVDRDTGIVSFYRAEDEFENDSSINEYYTRPDYLVKVKVGESTGVLAWGSNPIHLGRCCIYRNRVGFKLIAHSRYVVLPFGIAFGKPIPFGKKITLSDMATPLAEFTLRSATKHKINSPEGYPFGGFAFGK